MQVGETVENNVVRTRTDSTSRLCWLNKRFPFRRNTLQHLSKEATNYDYPKTG
jgi:hypothetical protein